MSAPSFDVKVTMNLDVPSIARRLIGEERRVLQRHGGQIKGEIKKKWTGWQYLGRDPKSIGRSQAAWDYNVQGTAQPFELRIFNAARSYYGNHPYVAFVHRAGVREPEHVVVFKWLVFERLAKLEADLTAAILKSIATGATGPMKQVNAPGTGPRTVLNFSAT